MRYSNTSNETCFYSNTANGTCCCSNWFQRGCSPAARAVRFSPRQLPQVPGGNAERDGKILVGDKLIATSAVVLDKSNQPLLSLGGAGATNNWRREMIPVGTMDFNSVMAAIKSNR